MRCTIITMRSDLFERMQMAANLITDKTVEELIDTAADSFLIGISQGLSELDD